MRPPSIGAVWIALPIIGVVFAASIEPLPPHDFWWHLVMGRLIALVGIPESNLFLYTLPADAPFHDQPWLAQRVMYAAHTLGGLVGGMFLRTTFLVGAWGILVWQAVRRSSPEIGGALALVAVVVSYPVLTYRTRLFAFIPFVVLLAVLLDERRNRWAPAVVLVATALWANVHGTFILAPLLIAGSIGAEVLEALAERAPKRLDRDFWSWWSILLAASLVGSLATPHGAENFTYVAHLAVTSNVSSTVSEWMPPDLSTGIGLAWGLAFIAAWFVLLLRRSEVRVVEAALFLATTYLAASAIRSVFWWAAAAALICAPHVHGLAVRWWGGVRGARPTDATGLGSGILNSAIILVLSAAAILVHPGIAPSGVREAFGGGRLLRGEPGVLSHENAVAEVEHALARAGGGVLFHDQALGGLIEWSVGSEVRPIAFVDQRMELIPESVWERYFEISAATGWEEAFREHDVRAVVASPEQQWPLVQALDVSPEWRLERVGQAHLVYVSLDRAQDPAKESR